MSTDYTVIDEWSEFTEEHLERFIAFREMMKDRKEALPKPSDMSVEEAFEKTKVHLLMCERWGGQHYYTEVVAAYNSKEKAQEEAKASQGGVPKSDLTYFVEEVDWAD